MSVTEYRAVSAVRDDLLGAAETVEGLPDDVLTAASHQAEPVVFPVLLQTPTLYPAAPLTATQISLHVPPAAVKTLRAEDLQEGGVGLLDGVHRLVAAVLSLGPGGGAVER